MNKILENDIEELILSKKYFEDFHNTRILITGATGLIGSIISKALLKYTEKNNANIIVYANCRNSNKFDSIYEGYKSKNLIPIFSDIKNMDIRNLSLDYVIHGASITDSKTFIEKPVETIEIAIDGTRNLLSQCKEKKLKGFVYLSSLEIYGTFLNCNETKNVTENLCGYIDSMAVRSSYSEGKRMVENICVAYESEYKVPVKICRLCQTFGAGVEYRDNRVFAQFARAVIESKDIVLKTKGETVRNYCYTTDAVTGILTVLSKGKKAEAYNIANMNTTISIADMAKMVCNLYPESNSKVIFDIVEDATKLGYNPVVKLQLDSTKLSDLGWKAECDLELMYKKLIEGMKNERVS